VEVDPAASLQLWAVEIELGGRTFEVPALPASAWFPVLVEGDPLRVLDLIPSSLDGDGPDVDEMILSGEVSGEDLVNALVDAIEEVAGRDFHAAFVLATMAHTQWPLIGGLMAQSGFLWDAAPIGAALDAIYAVVSAHLKEDARQRFEALLNTPTLIPGRRRPAARERALDEFESMAGPKPEGVRSSGAPSDNARPRTRPRLQPPRPAAP